MLDDRGCASWTRCCPQVLRSPTPLRRVKRTSCWWYRWWHGAPGARAAPQIISDAAAVWPQSASARCCGRGGRSGHEHRRHDRRGLLTRLPLLPQPQLIQLLRRARIVVSNGGDTLLQALACGSACVAVPIAHDQAARIARCRDLRLIKDAPLVVASIVDAVARLRANEDERLALITRGVPRA